MGLGKTYSTGYLLDSNNNSGAVGQVLSTTSTGVDWVDGSGSGIIGGPYLPLSAGSSYPLTGDLHINSLIKLASQITTKIELVTNQMTLYAGGLQILTGFNASNDGVVVGNETGDMNITLAGGANQRILYLEGSSGNIGIGTNTPDHLLDLYKSTGTTTSNDGTTLQRLWNYVGSDLQQQKTFIDFVFTDDNANEYPQVRIGAEVGQNGNAGTQILEGSGAFVVYTNNATGVGPGTPTGLAERFRVDYQGNVGIGTTNPSSKLHVQGSATPGTYAAYIHNASGGGNVLKLYNHDWDTGDFLLYATNGGTAASDFGFTVDGNARVNIGLATVATANAAADDLHLRSLGSNGITISSGNAQTGTIFFGDVANAAAAGFRYNHNTGDMAISAEDNVTFACDNVGIKTTSPQAPLHVVTNTDLSDALILEFAGTYQGGPYQTFQYNEGGSSPSENGDLIGGIRARTAYASGTYAGYSTAIEFRNDGNPSSTSAPGRIEFYTTPAASVTQVERLRIDSAGAIKFNTYTMTQQTGTSAYLLGVDASGNVVQSTNIPAGTGGSAGPYLPLAGGTMTGTGSISMPDNFSLLLGGGIFKIFNDGSNSIIRSQGEPLFIDANDITFRGYSPYNSLMTIKSTGNVGIGTTGPNSILEVSNTTAEIIVNRQGNWASGTAGIKFATNNAATDYWTLGMQPLTNNHFYLKKNAATYLTVLDTGNVGIGTTSPGSKLQVAGEIRVADGNKGAPSYSFTSDTNTGMYSDVADQIKFGVGGDQRLRVTSTGITVTGTVTTTDLAVSGVASVDGGFTSNGGNTMNLLTITSNLTCQGNITVQDSDKILIGNSGDLELYHVSSISYIDNNTGSLYIRSNVDGDDGGNIYIQAKSGENSILCNDDGAVQLYNNNVEIARTSSSSFNSRKYFGFGENGTSVGSGYGFKYGAVSPGTSQGMCISTSASGGGVLNGAARFENLFSGSGSACAVLIVRQMNTNIYSTAIQFRNQSNLVGFVRMTSTTTAYSTSGSDLRLKKHIATWDENVLDKFKKIQPKTFRFKTQDDSEERTVGFIAQNEVDKFPEAYIKTQFKENEEPMYAFNPSGMVTHLMKAIKELTILNEDLTRRVKTLEAK